MPMKALKKLLGLGKKNVTRNDVLIDFLKTRAVIMSCTSAPQLQAAWLMMLLFIAKHRGGRFTTELKDTLRRNLDMQFEKLDP